MLRLPRVSCPAGDTLGTVVAMSQFGDSVEALEAARNALATREADLADADRALADAVSGAHGIAVAALARMAAIDAELNTVATGADGPAQAHEASRHLLTANRDIETVLREVKAAVHAETVVLQELTERYR